MVTGPMAAPQASVMGAGGRANVNVRFSTRPTDAPRWSCRIYSLMVDSGKNGLEHVAGSAELHLLRPRIMDGPVADGAVDEPAQVAGGKFPGRTLFALRLGAGTLNPAGFKAIFTEQFARQQKVELALHVNRDGPPALLITVDGLDRDAQQLGHLFLGFFQFLSQSAEFFVLHGFLSLVEMSRIPYHFVFLKNRQQPVGTGRQLRAKVHNRILMPHSGIDVNAFIEKRQIAGPGACITGCPAGETAGRVSLHPA